MIISMIAAMGKNRVIGKNNQMMWHLPEEYKYFKETTLGHHIITGRKNFEAMGSRPLPKRTNIVVTRNEHFSGDNIIVKKSILDAVKFAEAAGESEVFICGGGQIYLESINLVDRIYLTIVNYQVDGDVYFPQFDEKLFSKKLIKSMSVSEKNDFAWDAYLFERLK